MHEPADTFEHAGLTVEIHYDTEPASPRGWSNVGTMVCAHRRANLGDEQLDQIDLDVTCDRCDGEGERELGRWTVQCAKCDGLGHIEVTPVEWARRERGARVVLPLWLYEHGGMTMRTSTAGATNPFHDPWDSGQVGIIFDTPEGVKDCMGEDVTDEQIAAALEQEVKTYDEYLTGQVYGYIVKGPNGEDLSELVGAKMLDDSCWGFYGLDYCKQEGMEAAAGVAEAVQYENTEAAEWAARDVVTEGV